MRNLVFAAVVSLVAVASGSAHANVCTPGTGVGAWITSIDGLSVAATAGDPCISAIDYERVTDTDQGNSGQLSIAEILAGLNGNSWFSTDTSGKSWSYLGKDESPASGSTDIVSASINGTSGSWSANFAPKTVDHFVLIFKSSTASVLALFSETGKAFGGGFDMFNLGLTNPPGTAGQGLSNFQVAGAFVATPPPAVVPLPAAGWLLLAGIGGLAAARRMKKAA